MKLTNEELEKLHRNRMSHCFSKSTKSQKQINKELIIDFVKKEKLYMKELYALMKEHGCSRHIRRLVKELRDEKVIERFRGRKTYLKVIQNE